MTGLEDILKPGTPHRLATGYTFTEGPLWDPQGFFYFADVRENRLYRMVPGETPQLVRQTNGGNGTTFDLHGNIIQCEGPGRRLTRWNPRTGQADVLIETASNGRLNRPNDVICSSDGSILFTDPGMRVDVRERENEAAIWRIAPDGAVHLVALCEYPNGLAFSPDERRLYVANTRTQKYLQVLDLDENGELAGRRIFGDMSHDDSPGLPDGVKVDTLGRVFCTGPGGIWVYSAEGDFLGKIQCPETPVNFCFGGTDLRTLFVCAHSSIYALRTVHPGLPLPWYSRIERS
ncbi:SMP-30/gluconolactonase/LRE family protein [Candidimonas humi]|uniref:SMP-30/gluconolactonase/LRE family protein n=1 Tax=Candidimonas humi TaxID=683355 RepID=A0ABV8NY74_9BURK|nr:SMP-30/gluconolactonase/LRE family protein [Candidimonas humi]MBV6304543.1 SMP-30/gluconolactonase/LRE family protein [Candidimonas humi]